MRGNRECSIETIYFGGGSPALLTDKYLKRIFDTVKNNFDISGVDEITIEVNPEEGDVDKLKFLKTLGFNRLSIGVQSFADIDLRYLERNHDAKQSLKSVESALKSGYKRVSVDLIIGLPVQDDKSLLRNIELLNEFKVSHVSAYLLESVKNFHGKHQTDPDQQGRMYDFFRNQIEKYGFEQYEVSSFCNRKDYSLHNLNYWEGGDYIGIGLGASGYEKGIDYLNYSDFNRYFSAIRNGNLPVAREEKNDPEKRKIFAGLRMVKGVLKKEVPSFNKKIGELVKEGLIEETEERFFVPPNNLVILNEIISFLF